jgi:hypothetical protein
MTAAAIRDRLITYLADADEIEIERFYDLVKSRVPLEDITDGLTEEQLQIVLTREREILSGKVKGIDRVELHKLVRESRKKSA